MSFSNLQDIPKEALSLVLHYHPDQYVYSILSEVCKQLSAAARYYKAVLQTRKCVLLLKGTPQLITTYSKSNSLSLVFIEKLSGAPIWSGYCRNSNKMTVYTDTDSMIFIIRDINFYYEETFYKYHMLTREWSHIISLPNIHFRKWNHIIALPNKHMFDATCCFIKRNTMILAGGESLPSMGSPSNIVKLVNIVFGTFTDCETRLPFNIGFPHLASTEGK